MRKSSLVPTLITFLLLVSVSYLAAKSAQAQSPSRAVLDKLAVFPTLIVYNGKIATMDQNLTFYQAMAIRDDKIWRLGTDQEIKELAGPQTQLIDLKRPDGDARSD